MEELEEVAKEKERLQQGYACEYLNSPFQTGRGRPRKNTALTDSQSGSEGQLSELSDSSGPLRASSEISNDSPNREGSGSDLTPIQEEKSPSENFDSPFEGIPVVAEGPEPMEVS